MTAQQGRAWNEQAAGNMHEAVSHFAIAASKASEAWWVSWQPVVYSISKQQHPVEGAGGANTDLHTHVAFVQCGHIAVYCA